MDRYLFRGKRIDNGEWITGDLLHWNNAVTIFPTDAIVGDFDVSDYVVDSATIGQCTDLRDKNGKLIFEGDIVFGKGVAGEEVKESAVYINGEYMPFDYLPSTTVEIIGNIHDNEKTVNT